MQKAHRPQEGLKKLKKLSAAAETMLLAMNKLDAAHVWGPVMSRSPHQGAPDLGSRLFDDLFQLQRSIAELQPQLQVQVKRSRPTSRDLERGAMQLIEAEVAPHGVRVACSAKGPFFSICSIVFEQAGMRTDGLSSVVRSYTERRSKTWHAVQAKERQLATLKKGAAPVPANLPERGDGEAREHAARAVGVSARSIDIADSASCEKSRLRRRT